MSMPLSSPNGGNIAIVGESETERVGVVPDMSMIQLHADAARRALKDAGLTPADVDGTATAETQVIEVAAMLGIRPRWMDGTTIGGCSFMAHVRHAAAAIATGQASVKSEEHTSELQSLMRNSYAVFCLKKK